MITCTVSGIVEYQDREFQYYAKLYFGNDRLPDDICIEPVDGDDDFMDNHSEEIEKLVIDHAVAQYHSNK